MDTARFVTGTGVWSREMPARKRHREAKRAVARLGELERLARTESDPVRRREVETETVWREREIWLAAVRFGHCSCGMGRCCRCGGYDVDGPYCGEH